MLALLVAITAAAWLVDASDIPSYNPFGTVAFIRTGERTPVIQGGTPKLSALGAFQMHQLGQAFRARYIDTTMKSSLALLGTELITGMSANILDSNQLSIQAIDTPYTIASSQAFMQGLYPPYSIDNASYADSSSLLSNDTAINYPLGGYQYAPIEVLGELDPDSVYVAGQDSCPMSLRESAMYQLTPEFINTRANSQSFYDSLNASVFFDGHLSQKQVSYFNAFDIYDYLSYAYAHDKTIHDHLANDTSYYGVYNQLRWYADEAAWYFWGNTSTSSTDLDLHAMAGKTVAANILGSFQKIWNNGGNTTNGDSFPMTLLFGEHEPFLSLFALMELDYLNKNFRSVPPYASAMIFELYSNNAINKTFPTDPHDLWVKFYFQNGTDFANDGPTAYPIFGRGPSGTEMPWLDFQDMMSRIMTNTLNDWCSQCSSGAIFCWGVEDSTTYNIISGSKKDKVSPTVAGVIGAVVTLAVAGLIFAVAMLLGGIRFHRVQRGKNSELGGFKGSAKLASDADLNLPKNGAAPAGIVNIVGGETRKTPHERVGSWELRQKEFGPNSGSGINNETLEDESRRESFEAIEAAMSRPVQPTERV